MKKSSPLVFFGNERLSSGFEPHDAPTLRALIENGYDVKAVVSNFVPGRSRKARKLEIEEIAEAYGIPVLLPAKPSGIIDELKAFGAVAGVLVAYGKIVPQSVIDIFPRGIINIHPSLLPQYRGSTPIEQAMLDGASHTGVSLMQLVREMDAGPVYAQKCRPLSGSETKHALTDALLHMGGEMLIDHLPAILDGSLQPIAQDESKATYCGLFTKDQGHMDLTKPAEQLEREVRAYQKWPKSRVTLFDAHDVVVLRTRIANSTDDGALVLACGNNTFLEVIELTGPSGKTMSGEAFLRGYSNKS
jgi:methionyl-tRNA formyltransferase